MLISEMVRRLEEEETVLLKETTFWSEEPASEYDYKTILTQSITLSKRGLVFVGYTFGVVYCRGAGRVLINGIPFFATGVISAGSSWVKRTIKEFVFLDAGSYTFQFQVSALAVGIETELASTYAQISKLGFLDVNDISGDSGSVSISAKTLKTILSLSLTPLSRKTPLGDLKSSSFRILVCPYDVTSGVDNAYSVMKNPDESNETDRINWRLKVDGEDEKWTNRFNDYDAGRVDFDYGVGCYGSKLIALKSGVSHSITIQAYNGFSVARAVRVHAYIVSCPWFLIHIDHEPLILNFPQGSTIYITLEPLHSDPIKSLKLGKERFVSQGADWYSSASGQGLLDWSYTFERLPLRGVHLFAKGHGGCISLLAIDLRG